MQTPARHYLLIALLQSLNESRGTAINCEPGTIAYVENYALARTLTDAWESIRRFSYQFDPTRLTVALDRWENILGLVPASTDTDTDRRSAIAAKFLLFNVPALTQTVQDFLRTLQPEVFVTIIHTLANSASGSVPGGVTVPGGVSLPDGNWGSNASYLAVRLSKPPSMMDASFYEQSGKFKAFFNDFLPAYMTYAWGRFTAQSGTISIAQGTTSATGTGTTFISSAQGTLQAGEGIEVYDDLNQLQTLTVTSVISDTSITVAQFVPHSITLQFYARKGFFLDQINLDNAFLSS